MKFFFSLIMIFLLSSCSRDSRVDKSNHFIEELVAANLFSGTVAVIKDGKLKFARGYGDSNKQLNVAMKTETPMPIGSNTKFFTTVAIYQLQQQGKLSVKDSVSDYLKSSDFGLSGSWCPKLEGESTCQTVTIRHILSMSSGVYPAIDCPDDSKWCWKNQKVTMQEASELIVPGKPIKDYVKTIIEAPLQFTPGSKYQYSNASFWIAAYIVESVSGMSLAEYWQKNIFEPVGLTNTYYDPFDGRGTIHNLIGESYNYFFSPTTGAFLGAGNAPWNDYMNSLAVANGAGGIVSTIEDMSKWYMTWFSEPEKLGLTTDIVDNQLLHPYTKIEGSAFYAQGIAVNVSAGLVTYCGGISSYLTCMYFWRNNENRSQSDLIAVFLNGVPVVSEVPGVNNAVPYQVISDITWKPDITWEKDSNTKCSNRIGNKTYALPPMLCEIEKSPALTSSYLAKRLHEIWELRGTLH